MRRSIYNIYIFYVSTTTSISTVNTCHLLSATNTQLRTCSSRKMKSFFNDQPFVTLTEEIASTALDIEPSLTDVDQRQGRFVNYWITTTFTTTSSWATVIGETGMLVTGEGVMGIPRAQQK